MPEHALELRSVTHRFGDVLALDDVSLRVRRNEVVAVVGESGSGKTTLLRCFNRLVNPVGEVRVLGEDVRQLDPIHLRRRMGYVPQEGGLMPHWSVLRNAALVARLKAQSDAEARAADALRQVGLDPGTYASRRPSALSGGQKQRVAIARALAAQPAVLLMDEPFGALDAITRDELHDLFIALHRDLRVTTLLVTHDLHEAAKLADRIAVMRHGLLEQVGTAHQLTHAPATAYVRALVSRLTLRVAP